MRRARVRVHARGCVESASSRQRNLGINPVQLQIAADTNRASLQISIQEQTKRATEIDQSPW